MATRDQLIVITGPTASGKSALALELAETYGGEIICADSRTVYKGMDIGTAKPTKADQARVRHHLLDVADPDEVFTAADFQKLARKAIQDISARGKIPFVVGGTGLYIDGLILNYGFGPARDRDERLKLERLSNEDLQSMIKKQRILMPENSENKRHLVRAIEQSMINTNRLVAPENGTIVVAIATEKAELFEHIKERVDAMFRAGVVDEAKTLSLAYGWDHESMSGNIYPIIRRVIEGELSEDKAKELIAIKDRQLAKRQTTWIKRHDFVTWLSLKDARTYVGEILGEPRDRSIELKG